jgi:hypothetical protein
VATARTATWIFLAGLVAWALCLVVDHDTPWYLAAGDRILSTGALPAHDPFSFTSTIRWLNHEWLSEVALALAHRLGGWPALSIVCALGVAIAFLLLIHRRDAFVGAAPIVWLLAAFVVRETVAARASLFSLVLLAATLALVLDDPDDDALAGRSWIALPLQLLWTQLHGGNPLGVALLGLRWLTGPTRRRAAVTAACALATLAGPYGWRVHAHFLSARGTLAFIREWQPLGPALRAGALAPWVFVTLAIAALFVGMTRTRTAEGRFTFVAIAVFGVAAMRWARFSTEASVVAAACLAPHLAERTRALKIVPAFALALLVGVLLTLGSARRIGLGLDETRFPIAAVDWLRRVRPAGPMFNSYNLGGYLLWARPEEPVFVDGRAFTVYSPELVATLPALYDDPSRWDALVARYGLRLAVLQRSGRGAALNAALAARADWKRVYSDPLTEIFVRP